MTLDNKSMGHNNTAVILIGFQNDYFHQDGVLHDALESTVAIENVLKNTINLIERIKDSKALIINTPIIFTETYSELIEPVGILQTIKEVKAFKEGTLGSDTVEEIKVYGDRVITLPGKRGLNAFSNTSLNEILQKHNIVQTIFAGAVTSICIDTTARTAFDKGFQVSILEDCTCGRSSFEQEYYCKEIFPLYADVTSVTKFTK